MRLRIRWGAFALVLMACAAGAESRLERGRYLMNSIVACGNCHTPQGPDGPVKGMELAGGMKIEDKPFTAVASNITPDRETGIGKWTDAQIIAAIREGRRPDGSIIGPPMPIGLYRGMADEDVKAIVAYLRSVKPVRNKVAASEYRIPLPPNYGPPVGRIKSPAFRDKVSRGAYLAGPLGHCIECHSAPGANGAPDFVKGLGKGGMTFQGPWGTSQATNITPAGLSNYSDEALRKVITTGVRPDGSRLKPPMGVGYYAHMRPADLDAVIAYVRSLPAQK